MSRRVQLIVLLGTVAMIVMAAVACGGKSTPPQKHTFPIQVQNAQVVDGGSQTFTVKQGDSVTFTVTSDTNGAIHVHGYELEKEVTAGQTTTLEFTANATGSYPVEFHLTETNALPIGRLNVEPK